ncbi:MAG: prepilin peptidase [gamma proteobacterium endosymbiont of Lamellibrachia anaximandri]|nr:prepilin peptidase [gamma proteobacterium endosymbiont of Lamellibrachia anaximandri]
MSVIIYLQQTPWAFLLFSGLLGLAVGSFLNVVIHRLPKMMETQWRQECSELNGGDEAKQQPTVPFNLNQPASHCPNCGHKIRPWENIPVLSWILLKGRCSGCKTRISPRYPAVEILSGIMTLAVAWHFGPSWEALAAMTLTWALISLSLIDFDTQLLPDNITLPFLWLGLLLSLNGLFTDSQSAIIGAAAGYLSLWSVYQLFKRLTGKEGMGYGDFKLLALLGAWLGWHYLPQIILLSAFVGALFGVSMILFRGRDRNIPIPFGPYLACAGWISLLWGDTINHAYLQWAGLL